MNRKEELRNRLKEINSELIEIVNEERKESIKNYTGKFFKIRKGGWETFTKYSSVIEVNNFYIIKGWYFIIYDNGDIQISNPKEDLVLLDDSDFYEEISKEEFYRIWENQKLLINKG